LFANRFAAKLAGTVAFCLFLEDFSAGEPSEPGRRRAFVCSVWFGGG
jgi:hypothetical protein